jgi:glycosyltransferase involved in cell wall biosynthesis
MNLPPFSLEEEKGVVAYDFLLCRGGAEQLTLALARSLKNAEICVAFRDASAFSDDALEGIPVRTLGRPPVLPVRAWRTLSGLHAFRRRAGFLADYDWAVFSGSNAPVAVRHRPHGGNLYYCHTPPRFAYDLYDHYLSRLPGWQRPAFRLLARKVRREYEGALARMDLILANSENVRARLQTHLGVQAEVVHPPCDVDGFQWEGQGGYYLSTARLEPYKRVDRIIEAFRRMPDKRLVVASGGSDEARLRTLAAGAPNIEFRGWVGGEALRRLVGNAIATLYLPIDEDFGMSPVESMAAGKPVIGCAEGGLLETVIAGQTGLLTPPDPGSSDIMEAVQALGPERAAAMRSACEERARGYSTERFLREMRGMIKRVTE